MAAGDQTDKSSAAADLSGRCFCGSVCWQSGGPVLWAGHCHCESCRRATASPLTSFFGVPRKSVSWSGERAEHASSDGAVVRHFCATCGTPLAYQYDGWPDETHLYAATLDDPAQFQPQAHFHYAEKLPWLAVVDDLPKYPGSSEHTEPL